MTLIANGYRVSRPSMAEAHDLEAVDPLNGESYRVQVKTIRERTDRGGELVVCAKNSNGKGYAKSEVDLFIGVLIREGEAPRAFMFENRECREYWSTEARATKRWVELPIAMNREAYTKDTETIAG
ncbi:hypothetical protein [Alteribacter populi]|uniref:hypothetical protein n=1 Tax=Alteribacter populi TaxID=2011011 RepID=UPI0018E3D94A|nr:hypothetical protein [Alteribacter populi]